MLCFYNANTAIAAANEAYAYATTDAELVDVAGFATVGPRGSDMGAEDATGACEGSIDNTGVTEGVTVGHGM